jgi:hypothetical protein
MEAKRNAYKNVEGKPERKKPLGRPRRMWEDNIQMDLRDYDGYYGVIDLAQDRDKWWAVVNTVMNFRVPYNVDKFLSG